jgi:hypothetical protein
MTLTIIFAAILLVVAIVWVACYRKAKRTSMENLDDVVSEAFAEPTISQPVVDFSNTVGPVDTFENCKSVECCATEAVEAKAKTVKKTTKKETAEPKPRKTKLERVEESIAKLEGQIGRRTTLLKQVKKPVTKDDRLNKWKFQLKELKAIKADLTKAAKKPAKKSKK